MPDKEPEIIDQEQEQPLPFKVEDKRANFEISPVARPSDDIMISALNKGWSIDDLERMMKLRKQNDDYEAERAFNRAMAEFKANPPQVWRDLQVKYEVGGKTTEWSHADLGIAAEAINKRLGEYQLNATWRTEQLETGVIKVTCIISHALGHSTETSLMAAPDTSGSKNAIQAIGSTTFYLERYTLFALSGLAPARMAGDGGQLEINYISPDQVIEINDLITETESSLELFLKFMAVESVEKILASNYQKAINALNKKKEGK